MPLTPSQSKKNAALEAEEIDAMGQESETGAVKWVQEKQKNIDKQQAEEMGREQEDLEHKRRYRKNPYLQAVLALALRLLGEYSAPQGYETAALLTDKGLVVGLHKRGYRWYAKGMKITGEPKYDINGVERLVGQAILSLDELQIQHEKYMTESGIILPQRKK